MFQFQLLRYVPDSSRDEFINIGVVVLDGTGGLAGLRLAGDDDLRRVRCLHPGADLDLLRAWQNEVARELDRAPAAAGSWIDALEQDSSLSLRWTPRAGYDGEDPALAAQQLYERLVASPPRAAAGAARRFTAPWVKKQADDLFRAARLLERFEHGVWASRFTHPGDPFRIHYSYTNGTTSYIHMLSLQHSVQQAKVLAFTFEHIQKAMPAMPATMRAVVEPDPPPLSTVEFTRKVLDRSGIEVVPLDLLPGLVRKIGEELRVK